VDAGIGSGAGAEAAADLKSGAGTGATRGNDKRVDGARISNADIGAGATSSSGLQTDANAAAEDDGEVVTGVSVGANVGAGPDNGNEAKADGNAGMRGKPGTEHGVDDAKEAPAAVITVLDDDAGNGEEAEANRGEGKEPCEDVEEDVGTDATMDPDVQAGASSKAEVDAAAHGERGRHACVDDSSDATTQADAQRAPDAIDNECADAFAAGDSESV
jgi:hypothetical protein